MDIITNLDYSKAKILIGKESWPMFYQYVTTGPITSTGSGETIKRRVSASATTVGQLPVVSRWKPVSGRGLSQISPFEREILHLGNLIWIP
ncbi:hypothetical protein J6590_078102 [Homalodisca vitripennis]|nr:hypothetical protein J6590_078102 [Homalodisca vitripennis]